MMSETVLTIDGMTCAHCKTAVEKALLRVPGVIGAHVDLITKQAMVVGLADPAAMAKAIDGAGFKVIGLAKEGRTVTEMLGKN